MITASFVFFLLIFLGIGLASVLSSVKTREDYYLASSSVTPAFVGLSAVATNNSGYMFIGVIGYTYSVGLASIWLMVGWLVGDFVSSFLVHQQLRKATERTGEASFGSVISKWTGGDMPVWRRLAAIVTIIFLGSYAAAQIAAGGKALNGTLGWDQTLGAWIVALMVLAYSSAGGIRASIWTDVAQSVVMLAAMILLFVSGVFEIGGISQVIEGWRAVPDYFDLMPPDMIMPGIGGLLLFILGWMFAGLSVIGQPHIMVRFMALDNPKHMTSARVWYYAFFAVFYALATGVGMLSRLYLPELGSLDPELALPTMANELLPPILIGAVLAGIFAATMSTADSLVLSCSAAITHDLPDGRVDNPWVLKAATGFVTALALFIALQGSGSVFDLVILSWSTLAVAFGPLLLLLAFGWVVSQPVAMIVTISGVTVSLLWRYFGLHNMIYEGMPGIIVGVLLGMALAKRRKPHARELAEAT